MFFSYGIPGALLFGLFLWRVLRPAGLYGLALFVPLVIYGFAHNGLRETPFWIVLAVIAATRWSRILRRIALLIPVCNNQHGLDRSLAFDHR